MHRQVMAGTGETDFTADEVAGRLGAVAAKEQAPAELLAKSDADLLTSLGLFADRT